MLNRSWKTIGFATRYLRHDRDDGASSRRRPSVRRRRAAALSRFGGKLGTVGEGEMSVTGPVDVRGTATLVLRVGDPREIRLLQVERARGVVDRSDPYGGAPISEARTRRVLARRGPASRALPGRPPLGRSARTLRGRAQPSAPLDELSFIYYLRTLPLDSDTADRVVRHYDPERNPISVRVIGRDTIRTNAGTFPTIIVEMRVKDPRRYGGEGVIRLHLSDDAFRYPVRIESSVPVAGRDGSDARVVHARRPNGSRADRNS